MRVVRGWFVALFHDAHLCASRVGAPCAVVTGSVRRWGECGSLQGIGAMRKLVLRSFQSPGDMVIGQNERAAMLAALACVDYVVVFDEDTPHRVLETLRPDVLAKGGTYTAEQVVGREVVEAYGGRVAVTGRTQGFSTSSLVNRIRGVTCS